MKFTTQLLRSGNLLRPDTLSIENNTLTVSKRNANLITSSEKVIPLGKVAGIEINTHLIGTDIKVYGYSSELIAEVHGFSRNDALEIKKIIVGLNKSNHGRV